MVTLLVKTLQRSRWFQIRQWLLSIAVSLLVHHPAALLASDPPQLELSPSSGTLATIFELSVISRTQEQISRPQLETTEDFKVSYAGQSSQIQIINGSASSEVRHLFRLTPSRVGELKTPRGEIYIGNQKHEITPLSVRVRQESPDRSKTDTKGTRDLVLSRELSDSTVYIGQQLNSKLILESAFNIQQGSFDELTYDQFWKEDLPRPTPQVIERNGQKRFTHQIQHALYPLKAGELTIPPSTLQLRLERPRSLSSRFPFFDSGFFQMTQIEETSVSSNATPIRVLPLPPLPSNMQSGAAHPHIPVGELSVALGLNTDQIAVGESKTITITLESDGNIRPIDELQLQIPTEISVYADTPKDSNTTTDGRVLMKRTFRFSLVPKKEGSFQIPGVAIRFFNPRTKQYDWARTRDIYLTAYQSSHLEERKETPSTNIKDMTLVESGSSQERIVYRFEEETLLERLSRSISLSLALFSASMVILLIAGVYALYRLRKPSPLDTSPLVLPTHSRHPLQLREDFITLLSSALGAPARESYRGYQLEREIESSIQDMELRTLLLRHLERLDAASYGTHSSDEVEQDHEALSEQSQYLLEQVSQRLTKR